MRLCLPLRYVASLCFVWACVDMHVRAWHRQKHCVCLTVKVEMEGRRVRSACKEEVHAACNNNDRLSREFVRSLDLLILSAVRGNTLALKLRLQIQIYRFNGDASVLYYDWLHSATVLPTQLFHRQMRRVFLCLAESSKLFYIKLQKCCMLKLYRGFST